MAGNQWGLEKFSPQTGEFVHYTISNGLKSNVIYGLLADNLTNAVKFTPNGGTLNLNAELTNGRAKISIIDNGVGIPTESLKNLFRIDVKTKTTGTNNEKGTGLGLILCKEFVEKNNGTIEVESTFGKGSRFSFWLPVVDE